MACETDRQGRQLVFESLLLRQAAAIRAIGGRMLSRRRVDLDDFVREVFLRAYASRDQLRDVGKAPQWVAIIARNTARNWERQDTPFLASWWRSSRTCLMCRYPPPISPRAPSDGRAL